MCNNKLSVYATSISSDQEWTTDPDMIEVSVSAEFLAKAEMCIAFMREHNIAHMTILDALETKMYQDIWNVFDSEKEGLPSVKANDKEYVPFTPEYTVDNDNARIYKNGEIYLSMPFMHVSGEVRCSIGELDSLKALMS